MILTVVALLIFTGYIVLFRNMLDYRIISIMILFTDIIFVLLESSAKVVALTYIYIDKKGSKHQGKEETDCFLFLL